MQGVWAIEMFFSETIDIFGLLSLFFLREKVS